MGRKPASVRTTKTLVYNVVCDFHALGFGARVIASMTGYHPSHIKRIMHEMGLPAQRHNNEDMECRLHGVPDELLFRAETIREANARFEGRHLQLDDAA